MKGQQMKDKAIATLTFPGVTVQVTCSSSSTLGSGRLVDKRITIKDLPTDVHNDWCALHRRLGRCVRELQVLVDDTDWGRAVMLDKNYQALKRQKKKKRK